jgi:hypothetical protein
MNFKKINNIAGCCVFALSYFVYLSTMERTVSFWDCGEFLSAAYRLEVGHSPGAPLFMLLGRLFSLFATAPVHVALFINSLSALTSALTILFLFWTITHFAGRIIHKEEDGDNTGKTIAIIGAGLVGALAYTFSDSFWFSAVEAEVYATSSFFTAFVFWAILKWEHTADEPYADRWIILIAYLMGLSIGVHLLNLLTIPAITFVYYFRKYKPTLRGGVTAFIIGVVLLAAFQVGLIQGVPILASKFELFCVNTLRLPFNSGAIFFLVLLAGLLTFFIIWAQKKGKRHLQTGLLCFVFALIGYSSYIAVIIRSKANVPIDMTNPDDVISLVSYVQRAQYAAQPILFGPDYDSRPSGYTQGTTLYKDEQKDGKDFYKEIGHQQWEPEYDASEKRFFPRIWSQQGGHAQFYEQYLDIPDGQAPSTVDNYKFFFDYQLNWMWWRYFMWNFSGRQNDYQGSSYGEAQNGNWISGIAPVDKMMGRGDIHKMPKYYRDNRARNCLYFLPFILGLLGLVYQFNRRRKDATVIALLFFFTGIALVIYINNTPQQPRERDYSYAGSTYAFAIWIGLGVLLVADWLKKPLKNRRNAAIAATLLCLAAVPVLMASQEWDDHDRSQKTLARSTAYNVLSSCDSNAILFVIGDNDTYPLWYMQEVEGYRTDIRIVNLSLLGIDWYIDQLNYKINDADAVPMIWKPWQYAGTKRNMVFYQQNPSIPANRYFDIEQVLNYVTSDDQSHQRQIVTGDYINILPTKNISIKVDKQAVLANGIVPLADSAKIPPVMQFTLPGNTLNKSDLGVLNIIAGVAKAGWKRPIYFSCGFSGGDGYQGLDEYVQLEGLANKLIPIPTKGSAPGIGSPQMVNLDKSLDLFTKKFLWGGAERKDVYFDQPNKNMLMTYRISGAKIAEALIRAGRNADAIKLLDKITENITYTSYPYDESMWGVVAAYFHAGDTAKAGKIGDIIVRDNGQMLHYLLSLTGRVRDVSIAVDAKSSLSAIQFMAGVAQQVGDAAKAKEWNQVFSSYASQFGATAAR